MTGDIALPRFQFRPDQPSIWAMLRQGVDDPAAVFPAAILDQPAVQLPGPGAPLVVAAPDLVRQVLNDRGENFTRDRFMRRLLRRSWGQGLAAAEGEDWQRQRRAAVPFFRPQMVKDQLAAFAAAADAVLDDLPDQAEIDLVGLSARIVARVVFGVLVDGEGLADPDAAARDVPALIRRIGRFTALDLLPLPERLLDWRSGMNRDPAVSRLRSLAAQLAKARKTGAARADMIALLEGQGPLEDNIGGLFPAAMETTVAGLGWAFYMMAVRPEWQDQVAAEGRTLKGSIGLDQLAVSRQVINEVLRLYPPAPIMSRMAARDLDLGGHRVKAGQPVLVAVYAMHRHRLYWALPDQFDPLRFAPGTATPDAFMPFGSGPRMCIAAQFAQAEMAVILARVLARVRLEPTGAEPQVSLKVTTNSLSGLHARLDPRAAA
jgi:cytochrome P450